MSRPRTELRVPPLALCLVAAVAQRGLIQGASSSRRSNRAAAAAAGAASASLLLAPVLQFRARRTTVDPRPGAAPSTLVTDGLNGRTRNPMYLGMAGALVAHALWLGHGRTLLPLAAFAAWMDRIQIPAEEATLRAQFGTSYDAYTAQVPRWLGRRR